MKTKEVTVSISGTSLESKEEAVGNAFHSVRDKVEKEVEGIVIGIKPIEVSVTSIEQKDYTERFLFIFMPRKKSKVNITLSVKAEVQYLEI